MNYTNPFGMAQDQNPVPNNPFWSGMQGQRNQANAYPFMQNEMQSQMMDLSKKGIETSEFGSDLARRSRETALTHGIRTKEADMDAMPLRTQAELARYREEIRAIPNLTDEKIARAKQVVDGIQSQPHRELVAGLGSLYDMLHKMPEDQMGPDGHVVSSPRAQTYLREVARFKMLHPKVDIPQQLTQYDPKNTMSDLAAIRFNQLNSPEQVGRERIEHLRGQYKLEETGLDNTSRESVARGNNSATRYAADAAKVRSETPRTAAQIEHSLRERLNKTPNDAEAKAELQSHWTQEFQKSLSGDIQYLQLATNPQTAEKAETYKSWRRAQFLHEKGVQADGANLTQDEYDWTARAVRVNSGMSWEEAEQQGRELKKIKTAARKKK